MGLTEHNAISIAELVVYAPCLVIAILLCIRHGFGRSAGWWLLVVFCLARIIGPCLQLATIGSPKNVSLYIGSAVLQNIGLSPLLLASLGLLGRALTSINKSRQTFVQPRMIKLITLILLVGLILGIVGGINAGEQFAKNGIYHAGTMNKAGTALFVVSYVLIVAITVLLSLNISAAEDGEKRLLYAVAISLPFLAVRMVFSCLSTFTNSKHFNLISGSVAILLVMVLIEEFVVVVMYESVGLTLKKVQKAREGQGFVEDKEEGRSHELSPTERAY